MSKNYYGEMMEREDYDVGNGIRQVLRSFYFLEEKVVSNQYGSANQYDSDINKNNLTEIQNGSTQNERKTTT